MVDRLDECTKVVKPRWKHRDNMDITANEQRYCASRKILSSERSGDSHC